MKLSAVAAALLAASAFAQGQEDASVAAERARLAAEREKVESAFKTQEKACYAKFAVNDCLADARARRRAAMDDLRRQEIALNDAQRKRAAAERRQEIEQKNNAQREREEGAAQKPASQPDRALRSNERAATRAQQGVAGPQKAAEHEKEVARRLAEIEASKRRRDEEAANNSREHEKKMLEAHERQEKLRKRAAERTRPPASSLADPK